MRDITLGNTIYIKFTTRAFSTGVPTTLASTPVLSIYEENNLTQITAGVSVTIDYDSVTGLNQATIVATSGNGYESGKSYDLVITTGTVGGVSVVGEVVGSFTVESEAAFSRIGLNGVGLSNIGTIATVTNLTNLPTIPANWLTAAGIAASALNGKGDWNIGKTGYSISGTLQTLDALNNFDPINDIVANVTLVNTTTTNTDMRGSDTVPDNAGIANIQTLINALNDLSINEILTTQMTESYNSDNVAPTLAQALYMIMQRFTDFSISGTTITVRRLDGTTTAATLTTDSATSPTSSTRST